MRYLDARVDFSSEAMPFPATVMAGRRTDPPLSLAMLGIPDSGGTWLGGQLRLNFVLVAQGKHSGFIELW